jgi:hypothetical protein
MEKITVKGYDDFVSESFAEEVQQVNEGKMKEIAMIAQESKTPEEYRKKLKKHLEQVAPLLAADEEVIDSFVKAYEDEK